MSDVDFENYLGWLATLTRLNADREAELALAQQTGLAELTAATRAKQSLGADWEGRMRQIADLQKQVVRVAGTAQVELEGGVVSSTQIRDANELDIYLDTAERELRHAAESASWIERAESQVRVAAQTANVTAPPPPPPATLGCYADCKARQIASARKLKPVWVLAAVLAAILVVVLVLVVL